MRENLEIKPASRTQITCILQTENNDAVFDPSMNMAAHVSKAVKSANYHLPGHDVNFCSDLPHRASEIQLSLALEKLYVL